MKLGKSVNCSRQRGVNRYVLNTLHNLDGKVLTFNTKDLVYKDQQGQEYNRHHVDYLVELGLIVRRFDIGRLVWLWEKMSETSKTRQET